MRSWLKTLRLNKGLTHQDIADAIHIERAYYTMIESGNRNPSVSVAKSIGNVVGFDWTIFFDSDSNEMKRINLRK